MNIRLARRHDYDQLAGLLRQLNPADPKTVANGQEVFREIIKSKYLNLIVAEEQNVLVGSCYLNIIVNLTAGARPYAVVENVVTDFAHRNRGIGYALINRAIELARERNCYKIMLMSGRADEAVHAFYRKCGFDPNEKQAYVKRIP